MTHIKMSTGELTSARVSFSTNCYYNFGTNFENFHQHRHKSLTSAHVILLHGAKVNILSRNPQLGTEVTFMPKLLVPNIDCPNFNYKSCEMTFLFCFLNFRIENFVARGHVPDFGFSP